jgi:hypothetical protein
MPFLSYSNPGSAYYCKPKPTRTLPSIAFQQLHQYHDPSFTGLVSSQKEPATLTWLSAFHRV